MSCTGDRPRHTRSAAWGATTFALAVATGCVAAPAEPPLTRGGDGGSEATAGIDGSPAPDGRERDRAAPVAEVGAPASPDGRADPQPDDGAAMVVPLHGSDTMLEPSLVVDTGSAVITRLGDRARDRHARESQFQRYDHYLPLYFENRTIAIEIVDRVAKGGNEVTVNVTSLWPLDTPDFRAFYEGRVSHSQYAFNADMTPVDRLRYTVTVDHNVREGRRIQVGDRMEIEISPFLLGPAEGRLNYYGTAFLYIVGQGGTVPWEGVGPSLDSFPLPKAALLGGGTTLSQPYSNEPKHRFKQLAQNLAPVNAQPMVEGRRLHHTDFGDGSHTEPGNPPLAAQQNKLGPRHVQRSCVGCHTNNGRALPPDLALAAYDVEFHVADAPWADLHYTAEGSPPQSFRMTRDRATGRNTHLVTGVPRGAAVVYHFVIGDGWGGSSATPPTRLTIDDVDPGASGPHGHRVRPPPLGYVIKVGEVRGGTVTAHPQLGFALQPLTAGGAPEGGVSIGGWTATAGAFGDRSPYELRRPRYTFTGPTPANHSARITPPLVGLGLLEAIAESTIAALADPNDANRDGISGRMQLVTDPETGQTRLGRFGWKAGKARLSHQIAGALNDDMGVTTAIFPTLDCGPAQGPCPGPSAELGAADLDRMVRYVALLGVPARRELRDEQALKGEALFHEVGCAACHVATLATGPHHPFAELRAQTIHPYTDLLLHDMGPELADNLPEAAASGAEWRTPPLWGIGLTSGVSGGEAYLHDGRARNLAEAILWHGGEGEAARERFRNLAASDRTALLRFLQSL